MIPKFASALRCSICGVSWPPRADYETCPECGSQTSPFSNGTPISLEEAEDRRKHAAFERYLEEHGRV